MLNFKRINQGSTEFPHYVYDCDEGGEAFGLTFTKARIVKDGDKWKIGILTNSEVRFEWVGPKCYTKKEAIKELQFELEYSEQTL